MITRFGMAPRLRGASIAEFQKHWRTSHADAAGQIPNLLRYTQNHGVIAGGTYHFGYPGFDACSELDFTSVEAMKMGFASEKYQTLVRADERAFVDKDRFSMMVGTMTEVRNGDRAGVKLLSLLRAHPAAGIDTLVETLLGPYADSVAHAGHRHEVFRAVSEAHDSIPAAFDAVDSIFLPDQTALEAFVASDGWAKANWELSGKASGVVRFVAIPVEVR